MHARLIAPQRVPIPSWDPGEAKPSPTVALEVLDELGIAIQ